MTELPSGLLATVLALGGSFDASQSLNVPLALPTWQIVPANDAGNILEVKKGGEVSRMQMRTDPVAMLDEGSPKSDAQRVTIDAGTRLIPYRVATTEVYCLIRKIGDGTNPCLLDKDADGKFEASFRVAVMNGPSFYGAAIIRSAPEPIAPVRYHILDPDDRLAIFWVSVVYQGGDNLGVYYGPGEPTISLILRSKTSKGDFPRTVELLDGRFTILSVGKNGARIRIDQAIPAQPFRLTNGLI